MESVTNGNVTIVQFPQPKKRGPKVRKGPIASVSTLPKFHKRELFIQTFMLPAPPYAREWAEELADKHPHLYDGKTLQELRDDYARRRARLLASLGISGEQL